MRACRTRSSGTAALVELALGEDAGDWPRIAEPAEGVARNRSFID